MADKLLDNIQSRQTDAWNKQKKNMPDVANGRNFNVQLNRYPEDLGGNDLLHYVEFGIVMRGKWEIDREIERRWLVVGHRTVDQ